MCVCVCVCVDYRDLNCVCVSRLQGPKLYTCSGVGAGSQSLSKAAQRWGLGSRGQEGWMRRCVSGGEKHELKVPRTVWNSWHLLLSLTWMGIFSVELNTGKAQRGSRGDGGGAGLTTVSGQGGTLSHAVTQEPQNHGCFSSVLRIHHKTLRRQGNFWKCSSAGQTDTF